MGMDRAALATLAAERIEAGALDEGSLESLARELGSTTRSVRRALRSELGLAPVELAQARRLALARELALTSALSLTEIAFASGFRSLRRFQAAFRAAHGCPPSELRRGRPRPTAESVVLRLSFRPALDWPRRLAELRREALPHCEAVEDLVWTRSVRSGSRSGWVAVYPARRGRALTAEIARLRRQLESGIADPFEAHLATLPRAALGRLVERFGRACEMPHAILTRLAPTAQSIATSSAPELRALGLDAGQARALLELARTMVASQERSHS
jgi:AraC family transcriptional regulator of adaptative response / DNA-3-methyladenine glycosylase II